MTVRIGAVCSSCGIRPSVPVGEVELWRRPDGCEAVRFHCPECGGYSFHCATPEQVGALLRLPVQVFEVPEEALERHDGPRLTTDDLIDFHLALASEDAVTLRAGYGQEGDRREPGTGR